MTTHPIASQETRQITNYTIVALVGLLGGVVLGATLIDQIRISAPSTNERRVEQKAE